MNNLSDSMYDYRHENQQSRKIYDCNCCGYGIYTGDAYYEVDDRNICEECIEKMKREVEEE